MLDEITQARMHGLKVADLTLLLGSILEDNRNTKAIELLETEIDKYSSFMEERRPILIAYGRIYPNLPTLNDLINTKDLIKEGKTEEARDKYTDISTRFSEWKARNKPLSDFQREQLERERGLGIRRKSSYVGA